LAADLRKAVQMINVFCPVLASDPWFQGLMRGYVGSSLNLWLVT
jgi:hypothetical protein